MSTLVSEHAELEAFRQAVEEIGEAGWNTCMLYIKARVQQISLGLPEYQHVRTSDYVSPALHYAS